LLPAGLLTDIVFWPAVIMGVSELVLQIVEEDSESAASSTNPAATVARRFAPHGILIE
jgi:hypothetical protein